jgi:hypothetical protein
MIIRRRAFLGGLLSSLAAPAIVHAGNLMPIKAAKDGRMILWSMDVTWTADGGSHGDPVYWQHYPGGITIEQGEEFTVFLGR